MKFEKSADTKVIENVLSEMQVGDLLTYEQISAAIGRNVREFAIAALYSARRGLQKTKRMVFACEEGVGIRRLDDSGIVGSVEFDRKAVLRRANRTMDKLACVNFEGLTESEKRKHTTAAAQMGVVAMFSSKASTRKIEGKINGKPMAIGETLNLFTGK